MRRQVARQVAGAAIAGPHAAVEAVREVGAAAALAAPRGAGRSELLAPVGRFPSWLPAGQDSVHARSPTLGAEPPPPARAWPGRCGRDTLGGLWKNRDGGHGQSLT